MADDAQLPPVTGRVELSYIAPPPDLAACFGPMYAFLADRRDVQDHTRADFAQIRFMISGVGDYVFVDGRRVPTPQTCLLGPTTAATSFEVDGPMRVIGVSVLPLGWIALGAGDAHGVADNVLDLEARFGRAWGEMRVALRAVAHDADRAADLLWPFLRAAMQPVTDDERNFVTETDAWLADERSPRVEALQEATGLSARQIARLCNRYYGAPPKYLARKYRALRTALILARDGIDWTELCENAFYDQSHFIREFKHFIGLTPNQLRDNASLVMRLTMGRRDVEGTISTLSRIS
jgi:AraC-like DNA-binding protein